MGNEHPLIVPYETYKAKDRFFNLCVANEKQWEYFCIAINMPELFKDPKFEKNKDRVINREKLNEILIPLFSIKKISYWLDLFERFSVPAGPINSVKDSISEDQIRTTTHPEIGEFKYANSLNRIFNIRNSRNIPSPLLGEHSYEIMKIKLGLSDSYMEMLREKGAVIGPLFDAMEKQ
jgi:crotonobetainyl-CoA:carnitine CoA-transferase CaiB-like acyl-CoA transferase